MTIERPLAATADHLLLQAEPGMQASLREHVAAVPGVTEAVVTSGPYDVIARVAAGLLDDVVAATREAPGLWLLAVCRGRSVA